jgi:hypothetical protein
MILSALTSKLRSLFVHVKCVIVNERIGDNALIDDTQEIEHRSPVARAYAVVPLQALNQRGGGRLNCG